MKEITKEIYQVLKNKQIEYTKVLRDIKNEHKNLQREGNNSLISKLIKEKHNARIHNILYGLVKNKTYLQTESASNHFYYDIVGINSYTKEMMYAELAHDVAIEAKKFGIENINFEELIHG